MRRPRRAAPTMTPLTEMPVELILDDGVHDEVGDALNALPAAAELDAVLAALWAEHAPRRAIADVCVRVCTMETSAGLNGDYRQREGATNVLSFPAALAELPAEVVAELGPDAASLGDLAISAAVVAREAAEQDKPIHAHFVHLFVHGVLHLLGMDHETDDEAAAMEALEIKVLAKLDIPDPYAPCN